SRKTWELPSNVASTHWNARNRRSLRSPRCRATSLRLSAMSNQPTATELATIRLGDVAHTRSGDKGNHANIGVIAYTRVGFEFLRRELTAERMAEFFAGLGTSRVERFELPGIGALNFVL